jgi:hypothetical protein
MALWHDDPNLKGRFHPEYPDDLQVILHEGSFRFTEAKPELVWARIHEGLKLRFTSHMTDPIIAYRAILLNQPHHLKTFEVGQKFMLVAYAGYPHTISVTREYLFSRAPYDIIPCDKCGLPELFDPIPKLIEHTFSGLKDKPNETLSIFTSFCPLCGGTMMVKQKGLALPDDRPSTEALDSPPPSQNKDLLTKFKKGSNDSYESFRGDARAADAVLTSLFHVKHGRMHVK